MPELVTNRIGTLTWIAVAVLACLRLAHIHLLWADEDYHMAAAIQMLHGKVPYRDFWYDKPPLSALYYLAIGGWVGWPLRLLDAAYVVLSCALTSRIARRLWGKEAGQIAPVLLAFYLAFYLPSAVIPFAADAVMLLPHVAAVMFAVDRRPWLAGVMAGMAFWANTKAVFVLAACALFVWPQVAGLAGGFAIVIASGLGVLAACGALPGYWEQVWRWGLRYAAGSPVSHPILNGMERTLNWSAFHVTVVIPALYVLWRRPQRRWELAGWMGLSYLAVGVGWRFAPHYFLQLLPVMVVLGAEGIRQAWQMRNKWAIGLIGVAMLVPALRFGPRYISLASDDVQGRKAKWVDAAMDEDSQDVATLVNRLASPSDTLLVWGYRPDVYVYTRLASDGLFWDSQPLTGVAADRHLSATSAIYSGPAEANRNALRKTHPTWIVDGLSRFNPRLAPQAFPDLREWLSEYEQVGSTKLSVIYRRKATRP